MIIIFLHELPVEKVCDSTLSKTESAEVRNLTLNYMKIKLLHDR